MIGIEGQWVAYTMVGAIEVKSNELVDLTIIEEVGNKIPEASLTIVTERNDLKKAIIQHEMVTVVYMPPEDEAAQGFLYQITLMNSTIQEKGNEEHIITAQGIVDNWVNYLLAKHRKSYRSINYSEIVSSVIAETAPGITYVAPTGTQPMADKEFVQISHNISGKNCVDETMKHIYNQTDKSFYVVANYACPFNWDYRTSLVNIWKLYEDEIASNANILRIGTGANDDKAAGAYVAIDNNSGFFETIGGLGKKYNQLDMHTEEYSETLIDVNPSIEQPGLTIVPGLGSVVSLNTHEQYHLLNDNVPVNYLKGMSTQEKNSYKFSNYDIWVTFTNKFPLLHIGMAITLRLPKILAGTEDDTKTYFDGVWIVQKVSKAVKKDTYSVSVFLSRPVINDL